MKPTAITALAYACAIITVLIDRVIYPSLVLSFQYLEHLISPELAPVALASVPVVVSEPVVKQAAAQRTAAKTTTTKRTRTRKAAPLPATA
jgi:hypothetical protein